MCWDSVPVEAKYGVITQRWLPAYGVGEAFNCVLTQRKPCYCGVSDYRVNFVFLTPYSSLVTSLLIILSSTSRQDQPTFKQVLDALEAMLNNGEQKEMYYWLCNMYTVFV